MSTWTPLTKHTSSYAGLSKNSSSFVNQAKSMGVNDFLLLEDGFYVLQEDGFKIILEQSNPSTISWSNLTKN